MELKHESITLSSLVRRALHPTCSILICFSREGGGVLALGFLRSLYRRIQGILRSLLINKKRPSSHIEKLQVDKCDYLIHYWHTGTDSQIEPYSNPWQLVRVIFFLIG